MKQETMKGKNTPKETIRLGNTSVAIWSHTDGKLSLEKSWKDGEEWKSDRINLFTSELPCTIAVLKEALNRMLAQKK